MSILAGIIMCIGGVVSLLAAVGLHRFSKPAGRPPYARFHAAGKASPVAFLITALGAAISLGWAGAALLFVASIAMVLTLPVGVHLMFRAVHRTTPPSLPIDELAPAEQAADRPS